MSDSVASGAAADISVVVVNYRTARETSACVNSLKHHPDGFSLQIIVVDNASGDGSVDFLRAAHPDITVIAAPENGGFAYGNAVGFVEAEAPLILLLNPDAEVYERTLSSAVAELGREENIGMVGARVLVDR